MIDPKFSDEFKKYVAKEKYVTKRIPKTGWAFEFEHADSLTSAESRRVVDKVFKSIENRGHGSIGRGYLIQFWRAEEVNNAAGERRFLLTLRNQPFMISLYYSGRTNERFCHYRMKMHNVIVNSDGRGGGGPIGRVFQNHKMEFTPDVSYYPDKEEYLQRDIALSCCIGCSLVLPWRDYDGCVVGAVEFVTERDSWGMHNDLLSVLRSNSLPLDYCIRLCRQYDLGKDSLVSAVSEINEVIEELCKRRDVVRARTWMLCKHCNSLSTSKRWAEKDSKLFRKKGWKGLFGHPQVRDKRKVGIFELEASSEYFIPNDYSMWGLEDYYNLQKGEGVVGKATESSHNLVYCENVANLSIIEYPFAHFARSYGLSACFAICLRSSQTGDQVYVLEFFLDSSYVEGKNIRETLVPLFKIIRRVFRTFKFASGEKIGESLSIQVIDANSPDKVKIRHGESCLPSFLHRLIGESSTKETDDPMIGVETSLQHISMKDFPVASASTVQCEIRVTISATYGVDSVRFQLSASCGIHELYRQVSQKLQLADGTYDLKYPDDENDLIELTCDEDLQLYISSSKEQENHTLLVFVVPRS